MSESLYRRALEAVRLSARRPGLPVPTREYQAKQAATAARLIARAERKRP